MSLPVKPVRKGGTYLVVGECISEVLALTFSIAKSIGTLKSFTA